jgi:hypothetical protein
MNYLVSGPMTRENGPRWELLPGYYYCACGAKVGHIRNCRSGEERLCHHHQHGTKVACRWGGTRTDGAPFLPGSE